MVKSTLGREKRKGRRHHCATLLIRGPAQLVSKEACSVSISRVVNPRRANMTFRIPESFSFEPLCWCNSDVTQDVMVLRFASDAQRMIQGASS